MQRRPEAWTGGLRPHLLRVSRAQDRGGSRGLRIAGMEAATKPKPSRSRKAQPLESFNPATGELVGTVETLAPSQVQKVVDDVARVQPAWAELTLEDRGGYMRRAADVLLDEIDGLAELLALEQGKPRTEAYTMELLPTIDALHWCADAGPKILAD